MNARRREVLGHVARRIPVLGGRACPRVAVDGPDGSGKTVFADELAAAARSLGRTVVRVSLDDFHNPRAVRYRLGRESPEGFWRDSYDYRRFRDDVLEPFAPGGSRRYRPTAHDLATDAVLDPPPRTAPPGAVLVVDGLFLHREEVVNDWDLTVFLDVPFAVTARRMAVRDGTDPDPEHPGMRRYVQAQRIYFAACSPQRRAGILIDNQNFDAPRIVDR
ncbi:uridine kinase [Amorphoplanes digitatis]|uniref:Uridine kinase n=1 Tax=Actinoplanes digitatis TaxID=1868 RepID=A0A7W7MRI9_9ACTN|nr:uridine kinase [Actinoplanes digitatis]MBB4764288.1 uridine kinase [Actinoplanes digitatis]BFE73683.1 uridine kinase [Actinoplanes digitatis]GID96319.1 uridine kinase [Actinoplanes digitatis]